MRNALFIVAAAIGIAPFFSAGCSTKTGPTFANNTSSDWFGAKKLAGLFKSDKGQISKTETVNPQDPTSLAHKGRPPGADLYVATAALYERQENFAAAEDQYNRALKASPNDLAALVGYGHLLDRQGKLDQATTVYQQAVEHHPQDASVRNDLGLCYARRGMLSESVAELSKAIQLEPEKTLYHNNIATVLVEMGQSDQALAHLSVGQPPAVAHYNLACLLNQRGETQTAAMHFAQAAKMDPSMAAAQEWSQKLAANTSGARMTGVRSVEQTSPYRPNTQWSQTASAQLPDVPANAVTGPQFREARAESVPQNSGSASSTQRWPQTGADRNWSEYDVSGPSDVSASGGNRAASGDTSASRGSAYAMPPTPETMNSYSLPAASDVNMLPPIEQQPPRY